MPDIFLLTIFALTSALAALAGYQLARRRGAALALDSRQQALDRRLVAIEDTLTALDFHTREHGAQMDSTIYEVLDTLGELYDGITRLTGRASLESARVLVAKGASLETLIEEAGVSAEEAQLLMRFRQH